MARASVFCNSSQSSQTITCLTLHSRVSFLLVVPSSCNSFVTPTLLQRRFKITSLVVLLPCPQAASVLITRHSLNTLNCEQHVSNCVAFVGLLNSCCNKKAFGAFQLANSCGVSLSRMPHVFGLLCDFCITWNCFPYIQWASPGKRVWMVHTSWSVASSHAPTVFIQCSFQLFQHVPVFQRQMCIFSCWKKASKFSVTG